MSNNPQETIEEFLTEIEAELIALRERLHQIPEVGLDLPQTIQAVRAEFEQLDVEIHEAEHVSGFAAILRGGVPTSGRRPLVLLRSDMDALPVPEETGLPFASTNGAMHGCGHDMHMAGLVGAARALAEVRDRLAGDVLFLLQPGEEGADGAQHLIDEGLLEAAGRMPDHAYGLHVWSANYPHRAICSRPGALMASSDLIFLTVRGKGGHGSAPHLALDPVPIVAEMITQAQVMVAREFDIFDPVVVTCGKVVAGQAPNVIADTARAEFTLRAFKTETRDRLIERMRGLCQAVAQAHGATCEVELVELYPVTENDPQEVAYVQRHVEEVFPGRWHEMEHPVGAAEDFSKILQRIPGAFVFVSAIPEGEDHTTAAMNHSPNAIYDSARLVDCSTLLATLALGRLTPTTPADNRTE